MKRIFLLASLISLSSCFIINDAFDNRNKDKCTDNCYEQYQLAVKPCQNSLYGEECKGPLEVIYQDCIKKCKIGYNNSKRNREEDRRKERQERRQSQNSGW